MSDPMTLIAAGAAVGGFAGKVAEKTWDSAEKWLKERFGSHTTEAQNQARQNAAAFVQQIAEQVKLLEQGHAFTSTNVSETQKHPQFSAFLQQCLLNAAQTDSEQKHRLLAQLVGMRLASSSESTVALASQMAADAIARSTPRQLTLLALSFFIESIRPKSSLPESEYISWLHAHFREFGDFEFQDYDAWHLVALACVSYDPSSGRNLEMLLKIKGGKGGANISVEEVPEIDMTQHNWDVGLAGVHLTSVGSIVGGLSLGEITHVDYGMPKWDDTE